MRLNQYRPEKMSKVNLDALIKREDLFRAEGKLTELPDLKYLRIDADLTPTSHFFKSLRKADFQRVTSEWKPERVYGLIKSFINEDIIPACILWSWEGYSYIIDGGHRLSALVGWINDDYGDGAISKAYFGADKITKEQKKNADKTRELIATDPLVGPFKKYDHAVNNPTEVTPEDVSRAFQITTKKSIEIQWIKAKNSSDAETSFFKINGEASPIDDTEAIILKSRKKPNGIAARAIMHAGSGNKYWKDFSDEARSKIEGLATSINSLLFDPPLDHSTAKFPCGGDEYSNQSLEVVFGIINMINGMDDSNLKRKQLLKLQADQILPPTDLDGISTIEYLENVKRVISIVSGTAKEPYSLGLSPVVYFYSKRGRFQITAFLAMVLIASQWDRDRRANSSSLVFQKFCATRGTFEQFLLDNKDFVAQTTTNIGGGFKGYRRLADLFLYILDRLNENKSNDEILNDIQSKSEFGFIKIFKAENDFESTRNPSGKKLPKETANELIINAYLAANLFCPICEGRATFDSYNKDHVLAIRDQGDNSVSNLNLTHYYCNSTREKIIELKTKIRH
jgi:hypothetical protein